MSDTSTDSSGPGLSDLSTTTEDLSAAMSRLDGLSKTVGQTMTAAFKGAVVQGKSLDTVLRSIGERLSSKALDQALQPLSGLISGGVSSLFDAVGKSMSQSQGFARGGVFSSGRVTPFANGGVVSTPTYFPMRGSTGLMGEAGAEAILPLRRGPDGRLGVAAGGEGASSPHVTLNVTTPDAASFRRSEAQLTSMLARAVGRGRRGL